ncbi:beta-galactosidase [Microbacterium sp. W1N]|uniref:beta-galactosidase n=1 Tax=Microbacterium festucae TaxID=2977531 RepID=UPI0021BE785F|nr:beta-galactosidase [Microbacterium festucae]MCT9819584.1 beta-galactosidase [Microbacterium festucae]
MTTPFDGEQRPPSPTDTDTPTDTPPPTDRGTPRLRVEVPAAPPVGAAPLDMGDDDATANRVQLTTRYVTFDGAPWVPVMGEYHFSRDLPENWEHELRKMKAGGINVLAGYMLWIVHEEIEGRLRFDGHRDVRRFLQLADEIGLKVMLRIGPWAHGEARNGGFPDWLQALPVRHRSDDPAYLAEVRRWYAGIEEQVRGLFHTPENPGGPIIGIQVDNELYDDGPHLATLRALAEEVGMRAGIWTATGWGGAELPRGRVLPVYAGYSDGFWEESTTGWPAFGIRHFAFDTVRDDLTVGADLRETPADVDAEATGGADDPWPFVTCELGGGMAVAYHRRPLVDPDDVAALALTKIGSGSAWQGYYMYHGGLQVLGELSTTQESHATGYPNDTPVRDYDFAAPLGAVGAQRPHFHKLRQQHLMLDAFGAQLATAPAIIPPHVDGAPRWAVRGDGARGFLFANNHQPAIAALEPVDDVRFEVAFAERTVVVPTRPVTLPRGAYVVWPLRQSYGSIPALTVTAQPITQLVVEGRTIVLFAASDGIPVELQLEGVAVADIAGGEVRDDGTHLMVSPIAAPGLDCEVRVGDTTLVFLDRASAESVWRGEIDGRDTLVLWRGGGWFDRDGFRAVVPAADAVVDAAPPLHGAADEIAGVGTVFRRYRVRGADDATALPVGEVAGRPLVPVRRGGSSDRLSAPTDDDFAVAATVRLDVPASGLTGERSILTLDWTGDVMRVCIGDRLIADQFWYGRPFEIDLAPYRELLRTQPLTLKAFAWSPDTGVYVDPRVRPTGAGPTLEIRSAVLRPVRTVTLG